MGQTPSIQAAKKIVGTINMGKIRFTTPEQEIILGEIKKNNFLQSNFYFTGGTALSSLYLHHRYSDDLDFFSQKKFDPQIIFTILQDWGKKHNFTFQARFVEVVYICNLVFKNKMNLKLDFSYYPYKKIEAGAIIEGIEVDSLLDIAINKLLTVSQRNEVKDFVDLYFLLQKFSVWDLNYGVRKKFKYEIDPILLASDFLKVEDFDYLPRMIKPLTVDGLKSFFREKAKDLGSKSIR